MLEHGKKGSIVEIQDPQQLSLYSGKIQPIPNKTILRSIQTKMGILHVLVIVTGGPRQYGPRQVQIKGKLPYMVVGSAPREHTNTATIKM